jgi:hypothetical protein
LWTANLGKRGAFFYHRPWAGSFSINRKKAKAGVDFTPGYADARGFPRPGVGTRKKFDIPASRITRFRHILQEGPRHYEFFGMKVPITEEMRNRPSWTSAKLKGAAQHQNMGVLLFAKHKYSQRSMHIGWMAEMSVPEEGLATLLPAIEGIPVGTRFRMNMPGAGQGPWFFGQKKATASQINVFAPRIDAITGRAESIFQRTYATPTLGRWAKRNIPAIIGAGLAVGGGLYALNRLGRQITTPQTITTPPIGPPNLPAVNPTNDPQNQARSRTYNQIEGIRSEGSKAVQHRLLTDFGSPAAKHVMQRLLSQQLLPGQTFRKYFVGHALPMSGLLGVLRSGHLYSAKHLPPDASQITAGYGEDFLSGSWGSIRSGYSRLEGRAFQGGGIAFAIPFPTWFRSEGKHTQHYSGPGQSTVKRQLQLSNWVSDVPTISRTKNLYAEGKLKRSYVDFNREVNIEHNILQRPSSKWAELRALQKKTGGHRFWVPPEVRRELRSALTTLKDRTRQAFFEGFSMEDPEGSFGTLGVGGFLKLASKEARALYIREYRHKVSSSTAGFFSRTIVAKHVTASKPFVPVGDALILVPFSKRKEVLGELRRRQGRSWSHSRKEMLTELRALRASFWTPDPADVYQHKMMGGDVADYLKGFEKEAYRKEVAAIVGPRRKPSPPAQIADIRRRMVFYPDNKPVKPWAWEAAAEYNKNNPGQRVSPFRWPVDADDVLGYLTETPKGLARLRKIYGPRAVKAAQPLVKIEGIRQAKSAYSLAAKTGGVFAGIGKGIKSALHKLFTHFGSGHDRQRALDPEHNRVDRFWTPAIKTSWWAGIASTPPLLFAPEMVRAGMGVANLGRRMVGRAPLVLSAAASASAADNIWLGAGLLGIGSTAIWLGALAGRAIHRRIEGRRRKNSQHGFDTMGGGPVSKANHRRLTDFGSGRDEDNWNTTNVAAGVVDTATTATEGGFRAWHYLAVAAGAAAAAGAGLRYLAKSAGDILRPDRKPPATFLNTLYRWLHARPGRARRWVERNVGKAANFVGLKETAGPWKMPRHLRKHWLKYYLGYEIIGHAIFDPIIYRHTKRKIQEAREGPKIEQVYAAQMAYGQAGMGQPLNEMAMLNKPIHHAIGFEGSWLSGAWRRFHDTILPARSAVSVLQKLDAIQAPGLPAGYVPTLAHARGTYRDVTTKSYRSAVSQTVGFWKALEGDVVETRRITRKHLLSLKSAYTPGFRYSNELVDMIDLNVPSTAFHEMVEQDVFHRTGGRRMVNYAPLGAAGGHMSHRVVLEELRSAQVYDYAHGTNTLKSALKIRREELLNLPLRDTFEATMTRVQEYANEIKDIGADLRAEIVANNRAELSKIWNTPAIVDYRKRLSRYRKGTGKYLDAFESGKYSFLREIQKGKGNVRQYFPNGLEGLRRAESTNSIADGISPGAMAKGQHTTLTDFGTGRHSLRQLTKMVKVQAPSVMREQAIGSGIRSQRRRAARLCNTSAKPGSPPVHRNRTRAGVS